MLYYLIDHKYKLKINIATVKLRGYNDKIVVQ